MTRCIAAVALCLIFNSLAAAADAKLPLVVGAEAQPVKANAKRIAEALDRQRAEPLRQRLTIRTDEQAVMTKQRPRAAKRVERGETTLEAFLQLRQPGQLRRHARRLEQLVHAMLLDCRIERVSHAKHQTDLMAAKPRVIGALVSLGINGR